MTNQPFELVLLDGLFAIARLTPDADVPGWANGGEFSSITRTPNELSIVCAQSAVPLDVRCERGWRCLQVAGSIAFDVVGVLASIAEPIAAAGISLFAVSTFDTDFVLVKDFDLERAVKALRDRGHTVGGSIREPGAK